MRSRLSFTVTSKDRQQQSKQSVLMSSIAEKSKLRMDLQAASDEVAALERM